MQTNLNHIINHETKHEPAAIPQTKIVSAYGLRKCPKLVEQISGPVPLEVRVNALIALCDEMYNPSSVYGCTEAGVVPVLSSMISDSDYSTRLYSSKALAIIAKDANGLDSILSADINNQVLVGCHDPSEDVRHNIYDCILNITRTADGVDSCTNPDVINCIVSAIGSETNPTLLLLLLPTIYNIAGSQLGLNLILESNCIEILIILLKADKSHNSVNSSKDSISIELITSMIRTLGFICYDEKGKEITLKNHFIPLILSIVSKYYQINEAEYSSNVANLLATCLMALSAITTSDLGKKQCYNEKFLTQLMDLITNSPHRLIKLNGLKVIANISVFPIIRQQLITVSSGLPKISGLMTSDDMLIKRHANIAYNALSWKP